MKRLSTSVSRAELTYQTLLDEICDGALAAGTHLIQEDIAAQLGVSRQPVQQAMARLKSDGLVEEAPGRGLHVSYLDLSKMRAHYQIRNALDQLAARLAAQRAAQSKSVASEIRAQGEPIIEAGLRAVRDGSVKDMVRHDVAFHACIYAGSDNPLIATTAEVHWRFLRRVMGDVLRHAAPPPNIWRQHEEILQAVVNGDLVLAVSRAENHIEQASEALTGVFNDV